MSGVTTALEVASAVATIAGTANSVVQGRRQAAAQRQAQAQNLQAAQKQTAVMNKQMQQSQEQINQANAPRAASSSALAAVRAKAKGGASGTMLTGPRGVNPAALTLGKKTLLGS